MVRPAKYPNIYSLVIEFVVATASDLIDSYAHLSIHECLVQYVFVEFFNNR